ncbi:hypothetical protein K160097B7_08460 [[Clostridium] hylemonae]|uniref:HAD-IC family P-type ATPase n=1 Tax=[Clostridium] hylemonae TaxID=89153 RepID=UPI0036F1A114
MLAAERKAFDECGCGHGLHGHDGQNEHDHDRGHGHTEECHEHHEHIDEAHNHIGHSHAHECGGEDHAGHDHGGHQHDGSCGCGHEEAHTGQEFAQVSAGVPQKVYILENLSCANCAAKMEEQIRKMPEVEMATITYATKQLKVAAREQEKLLPTFREICRSIESEVTVTPRDEIQSQPKQERSGFFAENRADVLAIAGGAVLFVAGEVLERTAADPVIASAAFIVAYILLGWEIVFTAVKNLSKGHVFDENFLMSVATLAAFAIGDFAEAVGVMLFYRVGELFEHIAVERSRSQIMDAVDLRPEVVNLVHGEAVDVIPAETAEAGDLILVRPGDRIPLDGKVEEGESRIDTSPVTGEPVPVSVKPGMDVVSGCVNEQGVLKIRVEKPLSESMVTRILDSVENAAASKPKIDRFITRFARVYTPIVVAVAAATAVIPSLVTGDWNHWIYTAITFLVISCPCALVLSVPLAFFSGIGAGSRQGILFKGGVAIEALKGVKAVVMDKTGTITKGNFEVQQATATGRFTEKQVLNIAADCELDSSHPIGNSIVKAVEADRNVGDAFRGIGMAKWEQEDYEGARDAFKEALDNGAEKTGAIYNLLGSCEMKLNDPQGALSYYRLALSAEDSSEDLLKEVKYNMIAAYEQSKDWESARAKLKEYIAEYPDDETAGKEAEFLETRQ